MRVVVENGQAGQGGALAQFVGLFRSLDRARSFARTDARVAIGMTFDVGNWQWRDEPPVLAAAALAPYVDYVEYVHGKAVTGRGARRFPVAPAADDPLCRAVLAWLPADAPRGIEFPLALTRTAAAAPGRVARRRLTV